MQTLPPSRLRHSECLNCSRRMIVHLRSTRR
jgi:hypothetical protein